MEISNKYILSINLFVKVFHEIGLDADTFLQNFWKGIPVCAGQEGIGKVSTRIGFTREKLKST